MLGPEPAVPSSPSSHPGMRCGTFEGAKGEHHLQPPSWLFFFPLRNRSSTNDISTVFSVLSSSRRCILSVVLSSDELLRMFFNRIRAWCIQRVANLSLLGVLGLMVIAF